jgi:hypothetical protein
MYIFYSTWTVGSSGTVQVQRWCKVIQTRGWGSSDKCKYRDDARLYRLGEVGHQGRCKYRVDVRSYRLGGSSENAQVQRWWRAIQTGRGEGGGTYKYTDDIRLYRLGGDQETCQ